MQTLDNEVHKCTKPEIIAGRLTSIRNIYLRQELSTISNQIQAKYKERLPALDLVSLAAYEQLFNRQPLSLPEELRQKAVKYGIKYYQLYIEKLRKAEAQNGLCQNHGRLSCTDEQCATNKSNTAVSNKNPPVKAQFDGKRSNLLSLQNTKTKHDLTDSSQTSITSDNTSDSTSTSSTISTNEHTPSSTSTFSDTNTSSPSTNTSSNPSLNPSPTDSFPRNTSNESTITNKSASIKKISRTNPPKIIVRRPSNNSLSSNNTANSSTKNSVHRRLSPNTRGSKKKTKKPIQ